MSIETSDDLSDREDAEITSWMRWWHWVIIAALAFAAFLYFPLWRFDQKWQILQVGDSFDRAKQLLGDPGDPSYSVQGASGPGTSHGYVYKRYWKTYEIQVSEDSQRVTAKSVLKGVTPSPPPPGPIR